jgi:hypothetical protein
MPGFGPDLPLSGASAFTPTPERDVRKDRPAVPRSRGRAESYFLVQPPPAGL